jgi:hypothetical protein
MYDRKYSFAFSPSLGLCIANTDISLRRCRRETIFISCHVFRSTLIFVINVDRQGLHRCYFQFHGVDRLLCRAREAGRATNTRSDKAKSRRNGRIARVGSVGCRFSLYTLQGQRIPGYSGRERERERERGREGMRRRRRQRRRVHDRQGEAHQFPIQFAKARLVHPRAPLSTYLPVLQLAQRLAGIGPE